MIERDTFVENTGLQKNSMNNSLKLKTVAALSARNTSLHSQFGWRLTTIIEQVKSEEHSATTVITGWWGAIPTRTFFWPSHYI